MTEKISDNVDFKFLMLFGYVGHNSGECMTERVYESNLEGRRL